MGSSEHKNRPLLSKGLIWLAVTLVLIVILTVEYRLHSPRRSGIPADPVFVEKLKSAKHYRSQFPAQKQTIDLARKSGLRLAGLNAIGMELREVSHLATGDPESLFAMLSHLGGFGEIVWVDQWTNFPVKLPSTTKRRFPGVIEVPRRDAVKAALDAIESSGACLVKAGPNRYLIAKVAEEEKYRAAIRALGWLDGAPPPWDTEDRGDKSNAEP